MAPGPKMIEKIYLPHKVGDSLVYAVSVDGKPLKDKIKSVSKVELKSSGLIVSINWVSGNRSGLDFEVEANSQGLRILGEYSQERHPQGLVLKYSAKPGDSWEADYKQGEITGKTINTTKESETIEVPAGKFSCIRIDSEIRGLEVKIAYSRWYASGIGLVKEVLTVSGIETIHVLKSFSDGKN